MVRHGAQTAVQSAQTVDPSFYVVNFEQESGFAIVAFWIIVVRPTFRMGPGPSALSDLPAASMIAPVFFSAMIFPSLQCSYYTMSTRLVNDLAKCSYYITKGPRGLCKSAGAFLFHRTSYEKINWPPPG